jgi:hypothetical protein
LLAEIRSRLASEHYCFSQSQKKNIADLLQIADEAVDELKEAQKVICDEFCTQARHNDYCKRITDFFNKWGITNTKSEEQSAFKKLHNALHNALEFAGVEETKAFIDEFYKAELLPHADPLKDKD